MGFLCPKTLTGLFERSFKQMIYSREVEEMCPVAQGVHHGAAPIASPSSEKALWERP